MRRETFTNCVLPALLTAFVVGSALGESPEPTKVRVTSWNLEWFPNGSAHDASPEAQAQRIAAAADVLRPINPDIILLQEVRDYEACARLAERAGRPAIVPATDLQRPGDVLLQTHKELGERTKSGLAQATVRAAEAAAKAAEPLKVSNTAQLRDLAASAARVFGWDKGPQTAVQVNEFRITQEQLEQMRALCDKPFKKPVSEGDAT
jgi:hypothetical protein